MKYVFYIGLLFCYFSLRATKNPYAKLFEGDKSNKLLLIVNGTDCVNCYKAVTAFTEDLKQKGFSNVYLLISNILEREKSIFLKKTIGLDYSFKKIIVDENLCKQLNFTDITTLKYIKGDKEIYSQNVKESPVFNESIFFNYFDKQSFSQVDSFDISSKLVGRSVPFELVDDSTICILDRLQSKLVTYNHLKNKFLDSCDLVSLLENKYNELFMKLYKDTILLNLQYRLQKANPKFYKELVTISNFKVDKGLIYISFNLWVRKQTKTYINNLRVPILCALNKQLQFQFPIFVPQYIDNEFGSYLEPGFFGIKDNTLKLQVSSGMRMRDSLFCTLNFKENEMAVVSEIFYTPMPKEIPRIDPKNKLPFFYELNVMDVSNPDLYYFNNYPTIFSIQTNNSILIKTLRKQPIDPYKFHFNVLAKNNDVLVLYVTKGRDVFLEVYSIILEKNIFTKLLTSTYFNDYKYRKGIFYAIKTTNEKTMFYKLYN